MDRWKDCQQEDNPYQNEVYWRRMLRISWIEHVSKTFILKQIETPDRLCDAKIQIKQKYLVILITEKHATWRKHHQKVVLGTRNQYQQGGQKLR